MLLELFLKSNLRFCELFYQWHLKVKIYFGIDANAYEHRPSTYAHCEDFFAAPRYLIVFVVV